jgi:ADP-ribose pyrophosphatase YjhB (NUDIX family)
MKKGKDLMVKHWLTWVKALQSISQTGLHFSTDAYDRERYQRVLEIAAEILAAHSDIPKDDYVRLSLREAGYATPKVDVRGVVFREGGILLVREIADAGRWTLPGGWADVNDTPSQAVVREIFEESGFETRPVKLLAVLDRDQQGHIPPYPYHIYKMFFHCEIIAGSPRTSHETSEVAFFARDDIPELSVARVTHNEIRHFFQHLDTPGLPTAFD